MMSTFVEKMFTKNLKIELLLVLLQAFGMEELGKMCIMMFIQKKI